MRPIAALRGPIDGLGLGCVLDRNWETRIRLQVARDRSRQFRLRGEQVGGLPFIGVRPEIKTVQGAFQMRDDFNAVAGSFYAAFHNILDVELPSHFADVAGSCLEL